MKRNRLAIYLTIFLVLIAIVLTISNTGNSTLDGKDADFAVLDTASVTKIFIADLDTQAVLLERKPDGWILNKEYRASQWKVDELLNTMLKLRVRGPVSQASHNNVVSRMAGIALKVEVYQIKPRINLFGRIKLFPREVKTKTYYVGDNPRDNIGTFMLKEGAKTAYIMYLTGFKGFVMSRYSAFEDDWRDHTVFSTKLGNIKSVELIFNEEPWQSFRAERTNGLNFKLTRLADQKEFAEYDTLRLLNFLTSFADLRFEAVLNNTMPRQKIDSVVNSPFLHRITLVDMTGDTVQMTTFNKKKYADHLDLDEKLVPMDLDRAYALVNRNRDFVLIQYFVFDKIFRPALYFEPGAPEMGNEYY
ncbi:MAG TPA: DUF4340 domain-containing protein [Bacteroidales bacterium]|nr:DUF4340 domain-containing protein [Bacteroidales bacterium]